MATCYPVLVFHSQSPSVEKANLLYAGSGLDITLSLPFEKAGSREGRVAGLSNEDDHCRGHGGNFLQKVFKI